MHSMTVDAHRYFRVTLGQQLPMHAGLVLAQLIGPQPGVVLAHEGPIRVAAAA